MFSSLNVFPALIFPVQKLSSLNVFQSPISVQKFSSLKVFQSKSFPVSKISSLSVFQSPYFQSKSFPVSKYIFQSQSKPYLNVSTLNVFQFQYFHGPGYSVFFTHQLKALIRAITTHFSLFKLVEKWMSYGFTKSCTLCHTVWHHKKSGLNYPAFLHVFIYQMKALIRAITTHF
jgi:hypothetical protein